MNKKILSVFSLTFVFSFLFYGLASGVLFTLPGMRISEIAEALLVLASVPLLLGLAVVYSMVQLETSEEAAFGGEIAESASNFAKALAVLRSKAFYPFWITVGLSAIGIFLAKIELTVLGVIAILGAQICWATSRKKMHLLVEGKGVAISLETPLRFFIYLVDAFCVLITFAALAVLSQYAQVTNPAKILGLSLTVSVGLVANWYRVNRWGLRIFFGIQVMIVFVWVLLVSTAVNYGLDFREPIKTHVVAFGDCPDRKNEYFTNKAEKIDPSLGRERFEGCEVFQSAAAPRMEDKVETIHRAGALGVAWKQTKLVQ